MLNRRHFLFCAGTLPLLETPAIGAALTTKNQWEKLLAHDWHKNTRASSALPMRFASHAVTATPSQTLLYWLAANQDMIQKYRLNPLRAVRSFAYLTTALHDALHGLYKTASAQNPVQSISLINLTAGLMLEYLYPEESPGAWQGQALLRAGIKRNDMIDTADVGLRTVFTEAQRYAGAAIARAMQDGSAWTNALAQPSTRHAWTWRATPPLWATRPMEPGAPHWQAWLVNASIGAQCPPPVCLDEKKYSAEIDEVWSVQKNLTDTQREIADRWNLDIGTATPAGVWIANTLELDEFKKLDVFRQAALLSFLSCTMQDAMTACWQVKFTWWTERPVTAIRDRVDNAFMPYLVTPSFPSYVSGHATLSGAAAKILSIFLPNHAEAMFKSAAEAALSRLYGGIHFRSDNEMGLSLGLKVAEQALKKSDHFGQIA